MEAELAEGPLKFEVVTVIGDKPQLKSLKIVGGHDEGSAEYKYKKFCGIRGQNAPASLRVTPVAA